MPQDPVTGHHRPDHPGHTHWDGWNAAIEDALGKTGWDPGAYAMTRIEFFATVEVVNPGSIVEYIVKLSPDG
jgi:hypothetical protein